MSRGADADIGGHRLGLHRLWPRSIRARWLASFVVLASATGVLATVGIVGLLNTNAAIQGFDEEILPTVARSLELAERVTHLAAAAPYVAEVAILSKLTQERQELTLRQEQVRLLASELPLARESGSGLPRLLVDLQSALGHLIEFKREDLYLREDARALEFALEQIRREAPPPAAREVEVLVWMLQSALTSAGQPHLQSLAEQYQAREQMVRWPADARSKPLRLELSEAAERIFALRRQRLALEDRKSYLLATTRVLSDQLTQAVNRHVAGVRVDVSSMKSTTGVAVRSGLTAIMVVSAAAALALLVGFWTLQQSLRALARVTEAMTSLAGGTAPTQLPTYGAGREIDALVRAFDIFSRTAQALRDMTADITEQKVLLQTVFDNVKDGLSAFDAQGRLVTWNPQYLHLLRLPPGTAHVGARIEDLQRAMPQLSPDSHAFESLRSLNLRRQRQPVSIDLHLLDGRWLAVRSQPMPGGGFVTLYDDLSERRALELQVRQTQKMDVLGQLTGGVAHDFNNLLAAIGGNLQLLHERRDLSPEAARVVARALKSSERGAVLTNRLLAFARRQPLRPEAAAVDLMVLALEDLMQYSVGQEIRITMDLRSAQAHVVIDVSQLENALLNLALNAAAAMPKGGSIRIASRRLGLPPDPQVEISVQDTGHGMAAEVLERIFEPFFTTRKSEGSGLGLSIVYGFVKQSGGDIRVTSQVGHGTTFAISLPMIEPPANSNPARLPPAPARLPEGLRVLLVEDDEDVRDAMADILRQGGAQVCTASSGELALLALRRSPFDLLLSDVSLGANDDGLTLLRRARDEAPGMPALLMSGLPPDLLCHRYDVPASARILRKPVAADALRAAVLASLRPGTGVIA